LHRVLAVASEPRPRLPLAQAAPRIRAECRQYVVNRLPVRSQLILVTSRGAHGPAPPSVKTRVLPPTNSYTPSLIPSLIGAAPGSCPRTVSASRVSRRSSECPR